MIVVGLLVGGATSGFVHTARATLRPAAHVALLGAPVSVAEDLTAATLVGSAVLAPALVPIILLIVAVALFLLIRFLLKVAGGVWGIVRDALAGRLGGGRGGEGVGQDEDLSWLDEEGTAPPGGAAPVPTQARTGDDFFLLRAVRALLAIVSGAPSRGAGGKDAGEDEDYTWLAEDDSSAARAGS